MLEPSRWYTLLVNPNAALEVAQYIVDQRADDIQLQKGIEQVAIVTDDKGNPSKYENHYVFVKMILSTGIQKKLEHIGKVTGALPKPLPIPWKENEYNSFMEGIKAEGLKFKTYL